MSVYFIGCPHLGHKAIAKYRPFVMSTEENTKMFLSQYQGRIRKNDLIYFLGDAAFDQESLDLIGNQVGRKILIKGNHDDYVSTRAQMEVFTEIHGIIKYKGMWLTHCPIHPAELRRCSVNVHAHVHENTITKGWGIFKRPDPRYINCSVDVVAPKTGSWFLSLDEIKKMV